MFLTFPFIDQAITLLDPKGAAWDSLPRMHVALDFRRS